MSSYAAEIEIIGCLMMNMDIIPDISDLKPNMFSNEVLGRIYKEYCFAYENNEPASLRLIQDRLVAEHYEPTILKSVCAEVMKNALTSVGFRRHADHIISTHKARMLNKLISNMEINGYNYDEAVRAILGEIDGLESREKQKAQSLAEIAEEYEKDYFTPREEPKVRFGIPCLDEIIQLEGGDVMVIGARPAVGKSAFVTQVASYVTSNGAKVGFFNLEMLKKQMFERFIVSESGIGLTRLKRAQCFLNDEEARYKKAIAKLKGVSNLVISTGRKTISDIRRESINKGFDLIIIDYLQLVKPDSNYRGNRAAEVGEVSKAVKELAMDLQIPIIALSQMNRLSEMKDDKEPTMSELREAGDIEQDASVIALLWNAEKDNREVKGCKIDKNRQGTLGTRYLRFDGDHMRFVETDYTKKSEKKKEWTKAPNDIPFI